MAQSSVYIMVTVAETTTNLVTRVKTTIYKRYTYRFAGVTKIEHSLSLDTSPDDEASGKVNNAVNLPDQVELSVIENDVAHGVGGAAGLLAALGNIKRKRYLCTVVTDLAVYHNMLLAEITAKQSADFQYGWEGEVLFIRYGNLDYASDLTAEQIAAQKPNSNSSNRTYSGSSGNTYSFTASELTSALSLAGIGGKN